MKKDFVNEVAKVQHIKREFRIGLEDVYGCSVGKTRFTLCLYERYRKNLEEKKNMVVSAPFVWGEEKGLLLKRC